MIAPYMVYLGTTYDIRYPYYILGGLFLIGGASAVFLPETLHHKLPDTLEEGKIFGRDQKFFSLPKPTDKYHVVSGKENEKHGTEAHQQKLNNYNNKKHISTA